jgi:hypothetical protein
MRSGAERTPLTLTNFVTGFAEMTTTRELLQQALDALYDTREIGEPASGLMHRIRSHLAKPEPKPVAWMTEDKGNGQYAMWGQKPTSDYWLNHPEKLIPLFTKEQL